MLPTVTEDMMKLLCVIGEYTKGEDGGGLKWVKELPIMAIVYEGIVRGVFETYDYAPWSVPMLDGTRELLNVSREGKDDIDDLLDLRLISVLRLSTTQFGYITAYRLTQSGVAELETIPQNLKKQIGDIVYHECGTLQAVTIRDGKFFFHCGRCNRDTPILLDAVEDIPYRVRPYLPRYLGVEKMSRQE